VIADFYMGLQGRFQQQTSGILQDIDANAARTTLMMPVQLLEPCINEIKARRDLLRQRLAGNRRRNAAARPVEKADAKPRFQRPHAMSRFAGALYSLLSRTLKKSPPIRVSITLAKQGLMLEHRLRTPLRWGDKIMAAEWIPRLKGHAELVQRLVKEIPKALDRPSLTFDQVTRLHTVIEKGTRDFDEVLQLMDDAEVEETDRQTAESLARTWQHLSDAAEEKVRSLDNHDQTPLPDNDDGVSFDFADGDETEPTDIDRKQ
jgi:hypothetical protein